MVEIDAFPPVAVNGGLHWDPIAGMRWPAHRECSNRVRRGACVVDRNNIATKCAKSDCVPALGVLVVVLENPRSHRLGLMLRG